MESLFEKLNGVSIINGLTIEAKSQSESFTLKKIVILYALYFFPPHYFIGVAKILIDLSNYFPWKIILGAFSTKILSGVFVQSF